MKKALCERQSISAFPIFFNGRILERNLWSLKCLTAGATAAAAAAAAAATVTFIKKEQDKLKKL